MSAALLMKDNRAGPQKTSLEFLWRAARGTVSGGESSLSQYLRSFAVCLVPWTIFSLISFAQDLSRRLYWDDPEPLQDAWFWLVRIALSAALTPFVLWLGARWPIERSKWKQRLALHTLFGICFAFVRAGVEFSIQYPLNKFGFIGPAPWLAELKNGIANMLIFGLHGTFISYWIILSIQAGIRYYAKFREHEREKMRLELHASELRGQVAQARLGALKMQLQPHFLFNTLNAVVVLVRQQRGRQAEETLTRFSDLLRAVLDDIDAQEVPLYRELEYLRLYLEIEQTRFSDRLRVEIVTDPEALDAAVPHMGLQPILENAVRHGIGRRAAGGTIHVETSLLGSTLRIVVRDDGPGFLQAGSKGGRGMGLTNLRARLQQLYGERAELQLESGSTGGATVTVVLPYVPHPCAADESFMSVGKLDVPAAEGAHV